MTANPAIRFLRSPRLTVALIICLAVVFVLGQAIPQRVLNPQGYLVWRSAQPELAPLVEAVGFEGIYTSPLAVALLAAFLINLAALVIFRVPGILKRCRAGEPSPVSAQDSPYVEVSVTGNTEEVFNKIGKSLRGYRFVSEGNMFMGERFRFGPMGMVLFYVAFLLVVVGGLSVFYTRTGGGVILTEGQEFQGHPMQYRGFRPPLIGSPPSLGFVVTTIDTSGGRWDASGLLAQLSVLTPEGEVRKHLGGGRHVRAGDSWVRIKEAGVSPRIFLGEPGGVTHEDAYVSLRVLYGKQDYYEFPSTPYVAHFRFYPDYYEGKFGNATRSLELKNPVFRVQIKKEGAIVKDELMKPGDRIDVDAMVFGIEDIRLWGAFIVKKQKGTAPLTAGIVIGIIGILWSLIFHRRQIRGELKDGRLCLTAQSDYFPDLNERRLKALAGKLGEDPD